MKLKPTLNKHVLEWYLRQYTNNQNDGTTDPRRANLAAKILLGLPTNSPTKLTLQDVYKCEDYIRRKWLQFKGVTTTGPQRIQWDQPKKQTPSLVESAPTREYLPGTEVATPDGEGKIARVSEGFFNVIFPDGDEGTYELEELR